MSHPTCLMRCKGVRRKSVDGFRMLPFRQSETISAPGSTRDRETMVPCATPLNYRLSSQENRVPCDL